MYHIKNELIVETQRKCLHKLAPSEQTPLRNGRRLPRGSPHLRRPRRGHVRLCLAHKNRRTYASCSPTALDPLLTTPPALRQRHRLNRHPESPPRVLCQRLRRHRSGLSMPLLPAGRRRRSRRHACLHLSRRVQGNGRCSFVRAACRRDGISFIRNMGIGR